MSQRTCPECGGQMERGFVQAGEEGEEVFTWCQSDPRESIERSEFLNEKLKVRSFRLAPPVSNRLGAYRCQGCRVVVFKY